jgi:1L-myo-inositol 1-phosphate cytidylyltransferase
MVKGLPFRANVRDIRGMSQGQAISTAVILAAGRGVRLRAGGVELPKPLHEVAERTLLERAITTLARAGMRRVIVVVGYRGELIREAVRNNPRLAALGISIDIAQSLDETKSNGSSVLAVEALVDGPFLLVMCDHVYDVELAVAAAAADMSQASLWLCVDRRLDEIYDMDDATKVKTNTDRIVEIGKELTVFDAIDCGVFAVGLPLLTVLRQLWDRTGDASMSDGVKLLVEHGQARTIDIGSAFWQDVDTPGALLRAERILTGGVP